MRDSARLPGTAGFTLMELLVALGIFAITVGLVADLFLTASRAQARATAATRVQGDTRRLLEAIVREFRDGEIDHAATTTTTLALTDTSGAPVRFQRSVDACPGKSASCVRMGRRGPSGDVEWAPLTGAGVTADAFAFRTSAGDPFAWDDVAQRYASDDPPRATIYVRLSMPTGKAGDAVSAEAQTTVVSRVYRR